MHLHRYCCLFISHSSVVRNIFFETNMQRFKILRQKHSDVAPYTHYVKYQQNKDEFMRLRFPCALITLANLFLSSVALIKLLNY